MTPKTTPLWDQDSFRGYDDDGAQGAATVKAAINTNWTQNVDENFRIRFVIQEYAGTTENPTLAVKLQYNKDGDGWNDVTDVSSVVRMYSTAYYASGDDATQIIGGGDFVANNNWLDETDGVTAATTDLFLANYECECEFCCRIQSGNVQNLDNIELRIVQSDGTLLDNYTNTPAIDINKTTTTYYQATAGTLTTAGAITKESNQALAGILSTAGAITKKGYQTLAGILTTAGAIAKKGYKTLAGVLSTAGDLATQFIAGGGETFYQAVAGTLTTAGTVSGKAKKVLAGTLATAGTVARKAKKVLAGTITPAGSLTKKSYQALAGILTTAGSLAYKAKKVLAGTLTTAGSLAYKAKKVLAGTLSTAGAITKKSYQALAGILTTAGDLATQFIPGSETFYKALAGTLTTAGTVTGKAKKVLAGTLITAGSVTKGMFKSLAGVLSFLGSVFGFMPTVFIEHDVYAQPSPAADAAAQPSPTYATAVANPSPTAEVKMK